MLRVAVASVCAARNWGGMTRGACDMDTKQLATAAAHWLEYMDLSGYNNLFSESLLILQIAEYFRCKLWTVSADKDCDELLGATSTRGILNYDVYAQKSESEKIILEMKFVKATNPYYSRIVTDFETGHST
jgi:hypothetical protein